MLSNKLKQLRRSAGLTQSEFAKKIDVARTTYAMYEQGNREPDYATLQKIADYFEVSTDYLLGRSSHPKLDAAKDKEVDKEVEELLAIIEAMPKDKRSDMEMKILAYARGLADATDD